ncbi:hypothetical protein ACFQY7_27235 [Actinomadura luteofluorescens]|uniref:Uncharacterized protein n=1 Tax=Actinomadura luteofluorescens TaxID=46163 RepID=A0A7Y9EM81_9ACTN|nr:hypothetical protein [Actinomadura luteofluorescens]NYD50292.1 hypothetical protein [Actinomadura luteofluorescens]
MVYFDKSGRRIRRPLERGTPEPDPDLSDAMIQYILEVAAEHPRFTPEEVHAAIRRVRRRNDITKDMVRYVLTQRNSTSTSRRHGR